MDSSDKSVLVAGDVEDGYAIFSRVSQVG